MCTVHTGSVEQLGGEDRGQGGNQGAWFGPGGLKSSAGVGRLGVADQISDGLPKRGHDRPLRPPSHHENGCQAGRRRGPDADRVVSPTSGGLTASRFERHSCLLFFLRDVFSMFAGKILSISTEKGFGFIQPMSGGADVFFHCTAVDTVFKSLTIGQQVHYVPDESAEKPRAKSVVTGRDAQKQSDRISQRTSGYAESRPQVAEAYDFGFVTKLRRRKSEGFISSDKGGPEYFFDAANVTGEKKFFQLAVGDYVRFVPQANDDDPRQPIAKSVMIVKRHVPTEAHTPPKHPRSLGKKPTWR